MNCDADVVVIGGGPAGTAAAIWAALGGLRVRLYERCAFPRHRPGETHHPGAGSIFRQLGVENEVARASTVRHLGHNVIFGEHVARTVRFGSDENGEWRGYQILREQLDSILMRRAIELGVEVMQPRAVERVLVNDGRVVGAVASGSVYAPFIIDASGGRSWLSRQLGVPIEMASPPLRAYYSYCEGPLEQRHTLPTFTCDNDGWTWVAQIGHRAFHWTRMYFVSSARSCKPPTFVGALRRTEPIRGADVTWRRVKTAAGRGYFIVGDAAAVLDPSASHGVLRALMSGMLAAHAVKQVVTGTLDEKLAAQHYCDWVVTWYQHDITELIGLYRQLETPPPWLSYISTKA